MKWFDYLFQLSVLIKGSGECAEEKKYIADITRPLAATFTDLSSHSGQEKSVKITEIVPGIEIEIHIRFISTTLVIRQVLFFSRNSMFLRVFQYYVLVVFFSSFQIDEILC